MKVIVPAYNEEATIAETLARLSGYDVIVVANGCTDSTVERARSAGGRVIEFGEALGSRRPIEMAMDDINDDILIIDADLEVPPSELKKFLPHVGEYDVILGKREYVPRRSEEFCAKAFGIEDIFCTPVFYRREVVEELGLGYLTPYFAKLAGKAIKRVPVGYTPREGARLDDMKIYEGVISELANFASARRP